MAEPAPVAAAEPTPAWFGPSRGRRLGPPSAAQAALAARLQDAMDKRGTVACAQPEAWVHPAAHEVVFRDPGPAAGYLPLVVGDLLLANRYVRCLPLAVHNMIYVGGGYVVHLSWRTRRYGNAGGLCIDPLTHRRLASDVFYMPDAAAAAERPFCGREIAERALASIGVYNYNLMTFNCQHAASRIQGLGWDSPVCSLIVGAALVVVVVAVWLACVLGGRARHGTRHGTRLTPGHATPPAQQPGALFRQPLVRTRSAHP
jgi:hypothetical protein